MHIVATQFEHETIIYNNPNIIAEYMLLVGFEFEVIF